MDAAELSPEIEAAHIDRFCTKLARRVAIRSRVVHIDDLLDLQEQHERRPLMFRLCVLYPLVLLLILHWAMS